MKYKFIKGMIDGTTISIYRMFDENDDFVAAIRAEAHTITDDIHEFQINEDDVFVISDCYVIEVLE